VSRLRRVGHSPAHACPQRVREHHAGQDQGLSERHVRAQPCYVSPPSLSSTVIASSKRPCRRSELACGQEVASRVLAHRRCPHPLPCPGLPCSPQRFLPVRHVLRPRVSCAYVSSRPPLVCAGTKML
jgi:hypothetical protein